MAKRVLHRDTVRLMRVLGCTVEDIPIAFLCEQAARRLGYSLDDVVIEQLPMPMPPAKKHDSKKCGTSRVTGG